MNGCAEVKPGEHLVAAQLEVNNRGCRKCDITGRTDRTFIAQGARLKLGFPAGKSFVAPSPALAPPRTAHPPIPPAPAPPSGSPANPCILSAPAAAPQSSAAAHTPETPASIASSASSHNQVVKHPSAYSPHGRAHHAARYRRSSYLRGRRRNGRTHRAAGEQRTRQAGQGKGGKARKRRTHGASIAIRDRWPSHPQFLSRNTWGVERYSP